MILKKINYCLFLALLWSNNALAQFIEVNEKKPTSEENGVSFLNISSITEIATFFFALAFISSIIGFIFSGLRFITSGGSESALESAHNAWIASLIGLICSLVGYIITYVVKIIFS